MIYSMRVANSEVTDFYMEIIEKAVANAFKEKIKVVFPNEQKGISVNKNDWIITASAIDTLKYFYMGARHIITWFQGIAPEESYLRNKSRLRSTVLSLIEKKALKISSLCILVSRPMLRHYKNKYKINIKSKSFIMPCYNEELNEELFYTSDKYNKNIFTYVGSMEQYQGFEKIVKEYKNIELIYKDKVEFLVLTGQEKEAEEKIKAVGIKNYLVKYVPKEEVKKELSKVKFGFILRDNSIINRVATPTKISSYMAAGVIPIFTKSIKDFWKNSQKLNFVLCKDDENYSRKLNNLITNKINEKDIVKEYKEFFNEYYNSEKYQKKLTDLIKKCCF